MSTTNLSIRVTPRRIVSREEAAQYCGLPSKYFETLCPCRPLEIAKGRRGWDLVDLDRWLDSFKEGSSFDAEALLEKLGP